MRSSRVNSCPLASLGRSPTQPGAGRCTLCGECFYSGPLAFTGLQLRFLGPRGPGAAAVLQVTGSLGAWEAAAAAGWVYERGQECRGTVFELRKTGSGVRGL